MKEFYFNGIEKNCFFLLKLDKNLKNTFIIFVLVSITWTLTQAENPDKLQKGFAGTAAKSSLLSEKVTSIFIDSFNVKWFGTDKGILRFNDIKWDTIDINNYLLNNSVKKLAYERSLSGHELWIATEGGLTVAGFDVDGVTAATTYYKGNSDILNDSITAIGVDILHNKWIGTKHGISVFSQGNWASLKTYKDANFGVHDLTKVLITGIESYINDTVHISTLGGGILRYSYNAIDGFTGASTFDSTWSRLPTKAINSVTIYDTIQYYGSTKGLFKHNGPETKHSWTFYSTTDGLVSNNVRAVEVDNNGAIWIGTDQGLNVKNGKKWYTYITSDGLINPVINDIKKDYSGNVWIATNGGVEYFSSIPGRQTGGFSPIQSKNVIAQNVTSSSSDIIWTNGDGDQRILFIKVGNVGTVVPVNNTTYTANAAFGEGSQVDGWYCIYNGIDNFASVTGLIPNTAYRIMVCEYSGAKSAEAYFTETAVENPSNFTTLKTGIELTENDQYQIFPNPFTDDINLISKGGYKEISISVYSMDGKLQLKTKLLGNVISINTSKLQTGTYILHIINGQENYSYKVIKK